MIALAVVANSVTGAWSNDPYLLGDGRWFDGLDAIWCSDRGRELDWPAYKGYAAFKQKKVVLATAHLEHSAGNKWPGSLKALRPHCHFRHDHNELCC